MYKHTNDGRELRGPFGVSTKKGMEELSQLLFDDPKWIENYWSDGKDSTVLIYLPRLAYREKDK